MQTNFFLLIKAGNHHWKGTTLFISPFHAFK